MTERTSYGKGWVVVSDNVSTSVSECCRNDLHSEFFNHIELSGIPSDKLRLKSGVTELFIRNLDVPRLRNGARFQITHLRPKVVLATDMTGLARENIRNITSHRFLPQNNRKCMEGVTKRTLISAWKKLWSERVVECDIQESEIVSCGAYSQRDCAFGQDQGTGGG
ncbi:hypothetical protein AVEN_87808-1 [Araneus ventricosus]|uniref:DNA helicase Pif1-like 2B domain-containing protein n=1 Tax=Araneus ventricosus TaxID=182803 RepID=A0A4Y2BD95_ARAVE|nr:hypothetical protein AVEN_87808-1 [Araneus ventricosus]